MANSLRRVVSTPMLALYGIGNIVGAGIYVLVGKIAEPAGYLSVVAFIVAALVAFCAALSYAELASRYPVSAGVSIYLDEAFKKPKLSLLVGLFLVGAGTLSTATLLKGFTGYFVELVPMPAWIVTIGVVLILLAITLKGIKESVGTAAVLTAIEVGGILFLVGAILFAQPGTIATFGDNFSQALGAFDVAAFVGVISAAFIAFYAFVGFEDMVNIAEEVKKPQTAYPRAILAAMAVVTVLYVAVAVVALGVVPPQVLGHESAPLATAYTTATGQHAWLIVLVSLVATLNGIIVNMVMGSRFLYGLARKQWLPQWFAKISRLRVPVRGLVIVALAALVCALWLPISSLAQATSTLLLVVFFVVNLSLIVIRRRDTDAHIPLRLSHSIVPWFGTVASAALLIGQIIITVTGTA